jgi:tartrate dehydratase beta subunit/fumarate hydratase class I family protein
LSVRAIIGKTTMGEATLDAMVRLGCVHLTKVGICGNVIRQADQKGAGRL